WVEASRTIGDVRRFAQFARARFQSHAGFDFAIRDAGVLVGSIGLHDVDWGSRSAQIGYWIAPDARGRGIVSRACAALVTYGFKQLELNRIEICCVVENARSRAIPERLGFRFEGILAEAYLLHGIFRDIALYATTARMWRLNEPAEVPAP
ncbi:MAG: GNAT family N-acetyltransferase, partial [Candidatus Eremiobacteraeota bacterium]|nr:GNAT family N-acetyltransferase [Candidatus Eremiobacteraeota bacterium]